MTLDPNKDFRETVEYRTGRRWAAEEYRRLVELYASNQLNTEELRAALWKAAGAEYPSRRGELEPELQQTLFFAGAIRSLVDRLPKNLEGFGAMFEMGLEVGQVYQAEKWKLVHFLELKKKDASWWRKKKGDASPNELVNALSNDWWHRFGRKKALTKTSKWEILIDTLGTREMCALATLEKVVYKGEGSYKTYEVEGDGCDFEMISELVAEWQDGRHVVHYYAGEIVG
jgi:hypothetical protein